MIALLMAVAVTAALISPGAPQAATPDISGTWELSVTTSRGVEPATLTLKKNGEKFAGSVTRGTEQVPAEATVKDKAVTIAITAQTQSGPATFTLTGEVAGDAMSGTGE